ncbi:hypothetical protein CKAH01_09090 [Colletotrichum kahawae]|uniref:Uncharacterized protein n=1 Tax=Colletotrichum kahawae TaxID=34407 RepID=A0AAE0CZG9_COLKA|nr:hypothetical protein CKAH01_09090 [Colletotrichum kahawae]
MTSNVSKETPRRKQQCVTACTSTLSPISWPVTALLLSVRDQHRPQVISIIFKSGSCRWQCVTASRQAVKWSTACLSGLSAIVRNPTCTAHHEFASAVDSVTNSDVAAQ